MFARLTLCRTTHSMVGAVTGVGILEGRRAFNWSLLLKFFAGYAQPSAIVCCCSVLVVQLLNSPRPASCAHLPEVPAGAAGACWLVAKCHPPADC